MIPKNRIGTDAALDRQAEQNENLLGKEKLIKCQVEGTLPKHTLEKNSTKSSASNLMTVFFKTETKIKTYHLSPTRLHPLCDSTEVDWNAQSSMVSISFIPSQIAFTTEHPSVQTHRQVRRLMR